MVELAQSLVKLATTSLDVANVLGNTNNIVSDLKTEEELKKFIMTFNETRKNLTKALASVQLDAIDQYCELTKDEPHGQIATIQIEARKDSERQ